MTDAFKHNQTFSTWQNDIKKSLYHKKKSTFTRMKFVFRRAITKDVTLPSASTHDPETDKNRQKSSSESRHRRVSPSSRDGPRSLFFLPFFASLYFQLGRGYKFSSARLREAQVQLLKTQTGRSFLFTKSYTSPNVSSPSAHAGRSKGLIQSE